ncbi:MAG: hypothetical protein KDE15_12825 [Erythrobacter sp.]|nr:hypothetical protein [Erythrobacter sp.]
MAADRDNWRIAMAMGLALGMAACPVPALAGAMAAGTGALDPQLAALDTGDQLVIEQAQGPLAFAGHQIELDGFSGVAGYGSQAAYLIVIEGRARLGDLEAGPGRMLLIQPLGAGTELARYDARRLHRSLSEQAGLSDLPVLAELDAVARGQARGLWLGRLSSTSFNVATMGNAAQEEQRRARVGDPALRDLRFAEAADPAARERQIVGAFLGALARGDAGEVAQFLDPLPFGDRALSGGGDAARLAMAQALLAERDWRGFAGATPLAAGAATWRANGSSSAAEIRLRRTTEFAFVQSITVGE